MVSEDRSWERFELLILQWVKDASLGLDWRFDRSDDPSEEVPSLSGRQLDEGLRRLEGFGLLAGLRDESSGYFYPWVSPEAEVEEVASPYSGDQGEANLARFAGAITPKARWLLRQIANDVRANGEAPARTIRHRAGDVNEGTLGGWVASITAAGRRLDLPKPYSNTYEWRDDGPQNIYRMESEVAEGIQRLIDEDGNLSG